MVVDMAVADPNTIPLIPPEVQELLRIKSPTEGTADGTAGEPKVYKTTKDIVDDEAFLAKLLEDKRVAERIDQRVKEAADQRAEANDQRREHEKQLAAAQEDADQLERLRRTSPSNYADEMGRRNASEAELAKQRNFAHALANDAQSKLGDYVRANFPKDAITALEKKTYPGTYGAGLTAYFDDLTKATKEHWQKQWEKDELPALRKRILTEVNGGQGIEAQEQSAAGGQEFTTEYEMASAFQAGTITQAELVRWYKTHGVRRR